MQLDIKIMLDNEAYQGEGRAVEIANNLHVVQEIILAGGRNGAIYDSNGNKTGFFEIQGD